MLRRLLAVALVPATLLVPALALAASGSRSDKRGDAPPHADVLRVSASYKARGSIKATIRLAAAPDAAHTELVGVYFARRKGGRCPVETSGAMALDTAKNEVTGLLSVPGDNNDKPFRARARVRGKTITLSARARPLARKRWNCAVVATGASDGSRRLDTVRLRLRGR